MDAIDVSSLAGGSRDSYLPGDPSAQSGLDVRLLGSVRVFLDGRPLVLRAPRLRRLLALLALHANEMVPTDRLVEALWGQAPPSSVRQQVYNAVTSARQPLNGHAEIERTGSGYQLTVDEGRIDVIRFQRAAARAERAAAQGDLARTVELLEAALGEWRGPALTDLEGEMFESAAAALQEQRLGALESLSSSLLQVGDSAGAVRRLTPLVAEHPFRESLRALLMRGLHRVGRQAEALTVFEEGRRLLSEELGVNPGAGLREAHREVLGAEADSSPWQRGTGADKARAPCLLPAEVRALIGRERELAELVAAAQDADAADGRGRVTVVAIDGMGGVGKSALAVHAAHLLRGRFPDGQLYIDLHGHTPGTEPVRPADALGHFLQALGVLPQQIPEDVDMRAALYRDRLADTQTLLVLDNAASTAQVEALLPGTAGCMVLVTSRRRLAGFADAREISLGTLPEKVAVDLLRRAAEPVHICPGYEAAAELVGVCGHLPLAIKIVGARLKYNSSLTASCLVLELREEESRLGRLSDGERELVGVFDSSVKVLARDGQRLYRLLGLVPGPDFDAYAAAHLLGADLRTGQRLLQMLFDHNLLLQPAVGRYKFHDLLHAHARGLVARDAEGSEALERLLEYYLRTAWAANKHFATRHGYSGLGEVGPVDPVPELLVQNQALAWLRAEQPALLAAAALPELGSDRVISLIQAISSHLMHEGMWSAAVSLQRCATGIARELGDRLAEANTLLGAAVVLERQGRYEVAVEDASRALAVFRELGDRLGEAHALAAVGQVAYVRSRFADAVALYEQALEAYEEVGDRRGTARSLWRLGTILSFQGENALAAERVNPAMAIYRELGDDGEEASCHLNHSRILYSLGDYAAVRPTLERGLALSRKCGSRLSVPSFLQEIATHQVRAGDYTEAAENLREALRINRELGFPLGEGYDYLILGRVALATEDLEEALELLARALTLFREIESGYQGSALEGLARIHHAKGALDHAAELIRAALALPESGVFLPVEIQAELRNAGAALKLDMEGPGSALAEYETVLELAVDGGVPYEYAKALEGAARCELQLGRVEPGLEHLREAVDLYERIGAVEHGSAAAYLADVVS